MHRDIVVISLTPKGRALAKRYCAAVSNVVRVEHLHQPKPFQTTLRNAFQQGKALMCICATGIVVRTLAAVLEDKLVDPPVLVLDEQGQFVIPLLSGHEGGANAWAAEVAQLLTLQVVITTATTTADTYLKPRLVAGLGCSRGCSVDDLYQLLISSLASKQLPLEALVAVCSIDIKHDEVGLCELAEQLSLPFITYSTAQLRQVEDRLSIRSERVFREVGCYGVAEAAALVHADSLGQDKSQLIVNKQKSSTATVAIAQVTDGG